MLKYVGEALINYLTFEAACVISRIVRDFLFRLK